MYCAGHMTEDVWFLITPELKMCHYASLPANIDCIAATTHTHWTPLQSANTVVYSFIQNSDSMCVNGNQLQRKSRPCTDEPHYVPIIQPHRKDIQSNCTGWCTFDVHSVSLLTLNYGGMSEIEGRGINNFWHSQSCWGNVGFNKDCSRIISSNLSLKCF